MGKGGEEPVLCDPGSELRLGEREKKGENEKMGWRGEKTKQKSLTGMIHSSRSPGRSHVICMI